MAALRGWRCKLQACVNRLTPTGDEALATSKLDYAGDSGVLHKGRALLIPLPLLPRDPQPCFASNKAEQDFYEHIWFSRIRSIVCRA